jgi:branched-chain amino acid aminotransferase
MAAWTYFEGRWHEGNPLIMGPMTHAPWLGSCVFDGARAFDGVAPDLDRHCQRLIASAKSFGLQATHSAEAIEAIIRDGIGKFPKGAALYLRPMFWAESGFVDVDPDSTKFCASVYDSPLPQPSGFSICLSPFRKPSYEYAPTDAKAACHYPNSARALREARTRGHDNAVMLDPLGHVAELATANLWIGKDGVALTPAPNGTFLNGITRQRAIDLMRQAGVTVIEKAIGWREVLDADEVFSTGNYGKVLPVTRVEDRHLQPGPLYQRARETYWDFALAQR